MLKLFAFSIMMSVGAVFGQQITKINKYLKAVTSNDSTGIMKGKEWLIRPGNYVWDQTHYGIVIATMNEHVGLISDKGVLVLDTLYQDILPLEGTTDLVVLNAQNEYACFSASGKMKIPFAMQEFEYMKGYILSMQGDYQVLYDTAGAVVIERDLQNIDLYPSNTGTIVAYKADGKQLVILDPKDKLPANLAHVDGKIVMSKNETSVYDYFWFLVSIKNDSDMGNRINGGKPFKFNSLLLDTTKVEAKLRPLWRELLQALNDTINEPQMHTPYKNLGVYFDCYVAFQFTPAQLKLAQFPVTGVSYGQAVLFAKWMNQVYIEYYEQNAGYTFQFSLPTEEEWMLAARAGLGANMKTRDAMDSLNAKGCFLFNYANLPNCKSLSGYQKTSLGGGAVPNPSFNPSTIGLYNVFGNVAEITTTEGVAKGGSYAHAAKDASVSKQVIYSGPQPWLGIRLIAKPIYW